MVKQLSILMIVLTYNGAIHSIDPVKSPQPDTLVAWNTKIDGLPLKDIVNSSCDDEEFKKADDIRIFHIKPNGSIVTNYQDVHSDYPSRFRNSHLSDAIPSCVEKKTKYTLYPHIKAYYEGHERTIKDVHPLLHEVDVLQKHVTEGNALWCENIVLQRGFSVEPRWRGAIVLGSHDTVDCEKIRKFVEDEQRFGYRNLGRKRRQRGARIRVR